MVFFAIMGVIIYQFILKDCFSSKDQQKEFSEKTGNESKDILRKYANDAARQGKFTPKMRQEM